MFISTHIFNSMMKTILALSAVLILTYYEFVLGYRGGRY